MPTEDLTGRVFHRLTVLRRAENSKAGKVRWLCRCECGTEKAIQPSHLLRQKPATESCGCLNREKTAARFRKHGHTTHSIVSSEYSSYYSMLARCTNPNHESFNDYGGRGITVCDRWLNSFESFLADMGPKPEPKRKYSIERINGNGSYEPTNCKWATATEQARNTRNTKITIAIAREIRTLYATGNITQVSLAKKFGVSRGCIRSAIDHQSWREDSNKCSESLESRGIEVFGTNECCQATTGNSQGGNEAAQQQ